MALIVKVDGSTEEVVVPTDNALPMLQKIVGGYIEFAPVKHPQFDEVMVNEEGKCIGLELNVKATTMAGWGGRDVIVGDCMFVKEGEVS